MHFLHLLLLLMTSAEPAPTPLYPQVQQYLQARTTEFAQIEPSRRTELDTLAAQLRALQQAGQPLKLVFICTHNSRRSHLGQVWARAAALYCGLQAVETYSGGTAATALNPRTAAALQRAGVQISSTGTGPNPVYETQLGATVPPLVGFSKRYDDAANPSTGFVAIMTCTEADGACPIVPGAVLRVALPYTDPKVADNTPQEAATYDERSAQIARELLYVFQQLR
jgi:arsenate reductase